MDDWDSTVPADAGNRISKGRGFRPPDTPLSKPKGSFNSESGPPAQNSNNGGDDWNDWDGGDKKPAPVTTAVDDWGIETSKSTSNNDGDDWGAPTKSEDSWGGGGAFDSAPRRGGRGGGRGGGGSRACFKCNQEGHMSRECPNGGSGSFGGPRKCYNCQQEGHMSNDCPEPKKERGGPRTCNNCKQEGHMSRDCTEPRKFSGGPKTCHKCNQEGHFARECPNEGGGNSSSFGGDSWGDMGSSNLKKDEGGDTDWGNDFGNKKDSSFGGGGGASGKGGGSGCRKCGKDGHFARECTEEVLDADGKPKPPIYKPEDLNADDETLYDNSIASGINFDRYDKIPVNVTGKDAPTAINSFDELIKSETLKNGILKSKYTKPTPIQKYGIPIILNKRDLMACAQTGSGKTAAFLLPILQGMFDNSSDLGGYGQEPQEPICIIITPTRELAIQIYTEAFKFTAGSIVKPQIVYGGTSVGHQLAQLSRGTHLLVATPGRLLDFVAKGKIGLSKLKYLVLDEADRMIDQGFLPDVRKLVGDSNMPSKDDRQTLMFSATFADEVQRLAMEFLKPDYLFLTVGVIGAANSDVEQNLLKVEKFEKRGKLTEILGDCEIKDRTMIFVEQKKTADFLASFLSQSNYKATSIHGDRFQRQREEALSDFRMGRMPILVATSVASRGLDIKDVRHVINYDLPKEVDDYVHRIGRTGRVGNVGKATSFYDPNQDKELAKSLMKILKEASQVVPDWLESECSGGFGGSDYSAGEFGGSDIRKGNRNSSSGGGPKDWDAPDPSAASNDDCWD